MKSIRESESERMVRAIEQCQRRIKGLVIGHSFLLDDVDGLQNTVEEIKKRLSKLEKSKP